MRELHPSARGELVKQFPFLKPYSKPYNWVKHKAHGMRNIERMLSHLWPDIDFEVISETNRLGIAWPLFEDGPNIEDVRKSVSSLFEKEDFQLYEFTTTDFQALFGGFERIYHMPREPDAADQARRTEKKLNQSTAPATNNRLAPRL